MSEWAPRRFWKTAGIVEDASGFRIELDGRPVRTPGKVSLSVPSRVMAQHIAAEWDAQGEKVDPATMPWTRSANSAIDKIGHQRAEVEAHLLEYAGTDLLCYRAESPAELIARQMADWDPLLKWLTTTYGVSLEVTKGVMPITQPAATLTRLAKEMQPMDDFRLTGFHDLVALSGSFVLGLAVAARECTPDEAWRLSRVDEVFQIEQWGADEEAEELTSMKKAAFRHATEFFFAA